MSFVRLQKLVTYLLAGLGLLSLAFGGEVPALALSVLAVGLVLSWFVEAPLLMRPWWSKAITWVVGGALAGQILRGLLGQGGWLGLSMEFSGLLSLSRLCNRRTAADYQQIAMLAFMQLIAATVLTTDLTYAVVFVAFVVATPWVLTFAHLRREIERNYPADSTELGEGVELGRVLASRRIVDVSFLLWTALLSVPMLVMTLALFVFFPRIGLGMLNIGGNRAQHVSGFGNDVELGGFGVIRDDPTIVARVSPSRALAPHELRRVLRLRGTAFDHYDGRKWTRTPGASVRMSPIGEYYPLKRLARDDDLTLKLILDRLDEPVLFVPTGTVGLRLAERGFPGTQRERTSIVRGHGLDVRYTSTDEVGIVYEAVVSLLPDDRDVPVDRELDDARYLALPTGHERVIALARELTQDLSDPYAKAKRLEHYLAAERRFAYSLELPDTHGKPPLEAFLFEARSGHCEYFSSALAIMLRAVGIPARNVTGFVGGEYNSYGGYYGVRQADAHSWVEALLPERGWVLLEATPSARDEVGPTSMFRSARALLDAMRAYWITRVVGYDLRTQMRALRQVRSFFQNFGWSREQHDVQRPEAKGENKFRFEGPIVPVVVALVCVGLMIVVLVRWQRRRRAPRLSASAAAAQRLYRELERVLTRRGLARPPTVTPEAHARALDAQRVAGATVVCELTEVYVRSRYGSESMDAAKLRAMRKRLREVEKSSCEE